MTQATLERFVNLQNSKTTLPGPGNNPVIVHPFKDSLDPRTAKAGVVYVVEGDYWKRFAPAGGGGVLSPFPRPAEFGLTDFPPFDGRYLAGDAAVSNAEGGAGGSDPHSGIRAVAALGKVRAKGDVIRDGKLVVDQPDGTQKLEPLPPHDPHQVRKSLKKGIHDYLADLGVETHQDFLNLSDDVLLKIPGVTQAGLAGIRENIGRFLQDQEARARTSDEPPRKTKASKKKASKKKAAKKKAAKKKSKATPKPISTGRRKVVARRSTKTT